MKVRLPDGTVIDNVPDNISKSDLVSTLKRNGMPIPQDWMSSEKKSPVSNGKTAAQMATEGMGVGEKFLTGVGKTMSEPIDALTQLIGHVTGKSKEELMNDEKVRKENERLYNQGPGKTTAGKVGEITGEIAKMAPSLMTGTGLPTMIAQGAAQGAMSPVNEDDNFFKEKAKQLGVGGALGAGAKYGGDLIAKGASKLTAPLSHLTSETAESSAKKAMSMGYNIMAGQTLKEGATSRAVRSMEGSTGKVARINQKKLNSDILKEFGVKGNEINETTISEGKKIADDLFTKATRGNSVYLDTEFREILADALKVEKGKVPSLQHQKFVDIVNDFVNRLPKTGDAKLVSVKIMPNLYQEMRSSLGDLSQSAMNEGNHNLSRKYKTILSEMDDSVERYMSPEKKNLWDDARKKWHIWSVLRDASSKGAIKNGDIVPSEFAKLVRDESDTKWATGQGEGKIFELAKMVDKFPNAFSGNQKNMPSEGISELLSKGIGSIGNAASHAAHPIVGSKTGQKIISNKKETNIDPNSLKKILLALGISVD